jgi:hypothetical protein
MYSNTNKPMNPFIFSLLILVGMAAVGLGIFACAYLDTAPSQGFIDWTMDGGKVVDPHLWYLTPLFVAMAAVGAHSIIDVK